MTRYEMAVLVNRAVDKLEANIAAGQKANAADIAALKKLVDEFGPEIKAIQNHLATLDKQVADLSAANAANTATLKRAQFHFYTFIRGPGSYGSLTSAYAGPAGITPGSFPAGGVVGNNQVSTGFVPAGGGLPNATPLKFNDAMGNPGGVAAQNTAYTGQYTYGTSYMVNRLVFSGDVDNNFSYATRIEDRYYIETPNYGAPLLQTGNAGSQPVYCTSLAAQGGPFGGATTCTANTDYANNTSFRLNYAYFTWHPPSGFYVQAGRLVQGDGGSDLGGQPPNLLYSDYFNGALIGYYGPAGGVLPTLRVEAGWGVGAPASQAPVSVANPAGSGNFAAVNQNQIWGQVSYDFIPHHLNVGAGYLAEIGNSSVLWDASAPINALSAYAPLGIVKGAPLPGVTGLYCGINTTGAAAASGCPVFGGTNMTFGSVFFTYRVSDYLHINAEGVHHFGNDPFTGATWAQPNGFWGIVTLGNNAGPRGTAWADAGYIGTGFNGASAEEGITATTPPSLFAPYISNPAGYYFYYGGLHFKAANNVDIGVIGLHGDVLNGITLPASTQACPGCFITHDVKNAVYLQTIFSF